MLAFRKSEGQFYDNVEMSVGNFEVEKKRGALYFDKHIFWKNGKDVIYSEIGRNCLYVTKIVFPYYDLSVVNNLLGSRIVSISETMEELSAGLMLSSGRVFQEFVNAMPIDFAKEYFNRKRYKSADVYSDFFELPQLYVGYKENFGLDLNFPMEGIALGDRVLIKNKAK